MPRSTKLLRKALFPLVNTPLGFRWVQTITTNDPGWTPVGAPLQNPAVAYVDPKPNDDTKPFYWTDQEFIDNRTDFEDTPGRPAHPTGTINWDATLSLVGANGTTVTRFDSLSYGFSRATDGTVTDRAPTSPVERNGVISVASSWNFGDRGISTAQHPND